MQNWESVLQFAVNGLAEGSMFGLIALAIVLTFRASGVLNFASGSVGALGAFLFFELRDDTPRPGTMHWAPALFLALAAGALLGVLTEILIMRVLKRTSNLSRLIATLGIMAAAQGAIVVAWPERGVEAPDALFFGEGIQTVEMPGGFFAEKFRLTNIVLVVVLTLILRLIYSKTTFGLATSAVAENGRVAAMGGWSPRFIETTNFALSGALSTLAMICLVPITGLAPFPLALSVLPALAAAMVGRFSSFALTVVTAMVIGVAKSELHLHVESPGLEPLADAVPLLVIILVTVLSGKALLGRGESSARLPLPGTGRVSPVVVAALVAAGVMAVNMGGDSWDVRLLYSFSLAIMLLSIVVVTGYAGQLSLAQFTVGAFGFLMAAKFYDSGWGFEKSLLAGVVLTLPVGMLAALPALRTRGMSLAIATLGLSQLIERLLLTNTAVVGTTTEPLELHSPTFFGLDIDQITHPGNYALVCLGFLTISALAVANLRRGVSGRRLLAVRANERAAASLGIGVYGAKLYAFGLATVLAALAGVLMGFRTQTANLLEFNFFTNIFSIQYAVIGGIGWIGGAVIGASMATGSIVEKLLAELSVDQSKWEYVIAGLTVVAVLALARDGLASVFARVLRPVADLLHRKPLKPRIEPSPNRKPVTVEVRDLTVRFGGLTALDGVSFAVKPGEVVGLIGPNGAGKTTLLDAVTGFNSPATGRITMDGQPISRWTPEKRARAGLVRSWQSVELFEDMSVEDNLLVAVDRKKANRYLLDLIHPGAPRYTDLLAEVIDEFGLEPILGKRPSELDHGQLRLVGIARAIATAPAVLFLDEPAAGLDHGETSGLAKVITGIAKRRGIGVVLVEHDVGLVLSVCDRVVVLDFGSKIAEGRPEQIRTNAAVIEAYLGDDDVDEVVAV